MDSLRPRGTVEVPCSFPGCGWNFWVGALDPRLPDGPFICEMHGDGPVIDLAKALDENPDLPD